MLISFVIFSKARRHFFQTVCQVSNNLQVFDNITATFADLTAGFCEFKIHKLTMHTVSTISLMNAGDKGPYPSPPPGIFIHGRNIVDRGLIVLFFGLFSVALLPGRGLRVLYLVFFFVGSPWKFFCRRPCLQTAM